MGRLREAPVRRTRASLEYLARYTHRVAISNRRLVALDDAGVTFTWKDCACGARKRLLTLAGTEFLRRFLLHVLPKGFVRIRHFGFLAHRDRNANLERCRTLIAGADVQAVVRTRDDTEANTHGSDSPESHPRCPVCKHGRMIEIEVFAPSRHHSVTPRVRAPP